MKRQNEEDRLKESGAAETRVSFLQQTHAHAPHAA